MAITVTMVLVPYHFQVPKLAWPSNELQWLDKMIGYLIKSTGNYHQGDVYYLIAIKRVVLYSKGDCVADFNIDLADCLAETVISWFIQESPELVYITGCAQNCCISIVNP